MPTDDDAEPDIEQARKQLYRRFFYDTTPPPWREPGTEQGRDRMDADVLRLHAMTPNDVYRNSHELATLLEIADFQDWT